MDSNFLDAKGRRRVVVTGMGVMSPVGHTVADTWDGLIHGRSGVAPITQFDASPYPWKLAGEVKGFDPKEYIDFKEARRMSRVSQLAVAAARQALRDADFPDERAINPERTATAIGVGVGGIDVAFEQWDILKEKGHGRVSPFAMTGFLPNMPTYHVSLLAQAQGPVATVSAACATGTQSIGEAMEFIRAGRADVVICGGAEGLVIEAALVGFGRMQALSVAYNHAPEKASRPFDKDRDGFILSEGAGVLIIESLEHALARRAPQIYAELLGHASSSDAFHVAAQDPDANGAVRAMKWSIADANLAPTDISYINAHGTGTPMNDKTETLAIKRLFGDYAYQLPISSNKSIFGHAMGGSGALEAIMSICTLNHNLVPPTWNYETPDPECDLDYVPEGARPANLSVALSNSFGLGGQNACLVIGKYKEQAE